MKIAYYHVDCFTENLFHGNPAAVCVMGSWLPNVTLQTMAKEHSLPATAFIVAGGDHYAIRWFSPDGEIELCGHGSIAAAYVIFNHLNPNTQEVTFKSPLHTVHITRNNDYIILNFPFWQLEPASISDELTKVLGTKPIEFYQDVTYLAVLETEQQVRNLQLDMPAFRQLKCRNLIITAPGEQIDFVSRNFYPKKAIAEDPVTGSAHSILVPYWATRLNKQTLIAQQVSPRGGDLICELKNNRVYISGKAILYKRGEINFPI